MTIETLINVHIQVIRIQYFRDKIEIDICLFDEHFVALFFASSWQTKRIRDTSRMELQQRM